MHERYFRLPELRVCVNNDCFLHIAADYQNYTHFKHRQNVVKGTHSYRCDLKDPHLYSKPIATGTLGIWNKRLKLHKHRFRHGIRVV